MSDQESFVFVCVCGSRFLFFVSIFDYYCSALLFLPLSRMAITPSIRTRNKTPNIYDTVALDPILSCAAVIDWYHQYSVSIVLCKWIGKRKRMRRNQNYIEPWATFDFRLLGLIFIDDCSLSLSFVNLVVDLAEYLREESSNLILDSLYR